MPHNLVDQTDFLRTRLTYPKQNRCKSIIDANYDSIEAVHQNSPFSCIKDFINFLHSDITFEFLNSSFYMSHVKGLFYSDSVHIAAEQPTTSTVLQRLCTNDKNIMQ